MVYVPQFGFRSQFQNQWLTKGWEFCKVWSDFIAVALFLLVYFAFQSHQHGLRMHITEQPKINDFYFVDYKRIEPASDAKFRYRPLKVVAVNHSTVRLKVGNIAHEKAVQITTHVKNDAALGRQYFLPQELTIERSELSRWSDSGVIYDAARPSNIFINGWVVMRLDELIVED